MFTTDQWADYLIYRSYPQQRVFCDGRSDFYAAASSDYLNLMQGNRRYREILSKWDINLALCPVGIPLSTILKMDPGWKLVEDDGQEILFQRLATP